MEVKLKLRVGREESAVARVEERKLLGDRLLSDGRLGIAPKSLAATQAMSKSWWEKLGLVNLVGR